MPMDPIAKLIARVDRYLAKTGTPATTLGMDICGTTALISRLRAGRLSGKNIRRIWDYLEKAERRSPKRKAA